MEKKLQLKRNHHYVWAHYLKNWSLDDLNVWYITKKGNYAFDSVEGLAKERDFYKVNLLSEEDVYFIKGFSSKSPKELREVHDDYLKDFYIGSLALKLAESVEPPESVRQSLEAFQHNTLENLHCS